MKRILLVDDSETVRFGIAMMLQALGYEVFEVDSYLAASEVYLNPDVDLVFTDYELSRDRPEQNGCELALRIKMHNPLLPVVLASGVMDEDLKKRASKCGVDACLLKPFTMYELRQALVTAEQSVGSLPVTP